MDTKELRAMNVDELDGKMNELVESSFTLRFQHGTGQLENTARLKQIKRDIARINTIRREKEKNLR